MTSGGCPACGGPLGPWRDVEASEPGVASPIALLRCAACGTAVTAAPALAAAHDAGAYGSAYPRGAGLARPVLAAFDRARLRLLRDAAPPPCRLVDAGAGRGRFVAAARAAGYDATGIEPSHRGVRAARDAYGVELEQAAIEDARVAPGSAGAVTLWHVLEHVDEPAAALAAVSSWLRPGGVLLVGVPNLDSLQARLGGRVWFHLDVPRHRVHFTPAGIEALLRAHGLEPVRTVHVLAEHNAFGMWLSTVSRLTRTPGYAYQVLKRSVPVDAHDLAITLLALPLLAVAALVELLAGLARRGGTIAIVARRAP